MNPATPPPKTDTIFLYSSPKQLEFFLMVSYNPNYKPNKASLKIPVEAPLYIPLIPCY